MKKFRIFLMALSYFLCLNQGQASHLMGSDLTWKCVGQDSFLIKLVVYRDCNGISLSTSPITFYCANTSVVITSMNIVVGTPVDITPVCNTSCNRCMNLSCTFPYGINKYTMQGIVKLSGAGSCCNIRMSWNQSARNAAITTSTGAGTADLYIEASLNRCISPCDNSPEFTNPPVAILCVGNDYIFNYGVQDVDVKSTGGLSDSIVYEWSPPLGAYNSPIPYLGQYAYDKPIYFYGFPNDGLPAPRGIHLDPLTGDVQFRPMKAEVTIMVIKVSEYRNGVKIGEIRRDMQIIVMNCTQIHNPVLTSNNNATVFNVYAGDTAAFNFTTYDQDVADTVTVNWNQSIKGATWTDNNGLVKHPSATFTWIPSVKDISANPYIFTVTAKDNGCPINAMVCQSYRVYVYSKTKPTIRIKPVGKFCQNASLIKLNNYVTVDGGFKTGGTWSSNCPGLSGDTFSPSKAGTNSSPGWKIIYLYVNPFNSITFKDSVYITVYALPTVFAGNDTTICTGNKIPLKGTPATPIGTWRGTGVSGISPYLKFNPDTAGIMNGGTYDAIYQYFDNNQCKNEDTLKITVYKVPVVDAGVTKEFCIDASPVSLTGTPSGGVWTGKSVSGTQFFPSVAGVGIHKLIYTYTNVICTAKDTTQYTVWGLPSVTANTASGQNYFCRNAGQVVLYGQPNGGKWTGQGTNNGLFNPSICPDVTTEYPLTYSYYDLHNCFNQAQIKLTVKPEPDVKIDPSGSVLCFGESSYLSASYKLASGIYWWKGTQSDGSIVGPVNNTTISYQPGPNDLKNLYFWMYIKTVHSDTICTDAVDSIMVKINPKPLAGFYANDLTGGYPRNVQFTDSSTIVVGKISAWIWSFGDGDSSTDRNPLHTYTLPGQYDVKLMVFSDAGCKDELLKSKYISTKINQPDHDAGFKIYPNPAHNILEIENPFRSSVHLLLTDILGNKLSEQQLQAGKNQVNVNDLKPGIYLLMINGSNIYRLLIE